jgi:hypothetical protein
MKKEDSIRLLLDKYWDCETSPEEEQLLADFFNDEALPAEFAKYSAYFQWKTAQTAVKSGRKFKISGHSPIVAWFYPALKVAAAVLLALIVGTGFYTHYQQEKEMDRIFSETYTDPEDALQKTKDVIERVSSVLQLVEDKKNLQMIDSLEIIEDKKQ